MNDTTVHFVLLMSFIYYLLIIIGVVKLPQAAQARFDRQTNKRKQLWIILDCVLIVAFAFLISEIFLNRNLKHYASNIHTSIFKTTEEK
jgi:hypothetical protein